MKKLTAVILFAIGAASCGGSSGYNSSYGSSSDDRRWINQCISDNSREGQTRRVVTAYCTCMNNRMSNNETRSISQWERSHPRERRECSERAGWY
ncbi:hypothetical protein [Roseococcus sp. YIM B11640]|uniref:hypothetical protein n=1 Tax=Roseococcus sp. YIM B11640 TaxID=3133973 RepID=UPI003C7B72B9